MKEKTMTDKLDELLIAVAVIQNDVSHVRAKTDAIDNKVQHLNDKSIETDHSIRAAHKRIDDIAPKVAEHERLIVEATGGAKAMSGVWGAILGSAGLIAGVVSWVFGK